MLLPTLDKVNSHAAFVGPITTLCGFLSLPGAGKINVQRRESFRPRSASCLLRDVLDNEKGVVMFYVKNVPSWERVLRVVAGAVVAVLALLLLGGVGGVILAASAAGIALSGLVGFCPMCAMVGRRLDRNAGGSK